ncbi:MAG: hypothetical protein JO270_15375 [Acidobacteriaceae bacterium]|nr:hypothetical protein [Acidobacteriaceae bacterium]
MGVRAVPDHRQHGRERPTLSAARQSFFDGHFEKCLELCDAISLRDEATLLELALLRARSHLRLDRAERAIDALRDCAFTPASLDGYVSAQMLHGDAYIRLGQLERGESLLIDAYERSLNAHPSVHAEATVNLGIALYFLRKHEAADEMLASTNPHADIIFVRALEFRGWIGFAQGNFDAAVCHFRNALSAIETCKHHDRFIEASVLQGLTSLCAELVRPDEWALMERRIRSFDWSAGGLAVKHFWIAIYASMMCEIVGDDGGSRFWGREAETVSTTSSYRAIAQCRIAAVFRGLGESAAHEEFIDRATASYESADSRKLGNDQKQIPLFLAEESACAGRHDDARKFIAQYRDVIAPTLQRVPGDHRFVALENAVEASIAESRGDRKEAVRLYQQAFTVFRDARHVRRASIIALRLARLTRLSRYVDYARDALRVVSDRSWMAKLIAEFSATESMQLTDTQISMLKLLVEGRTYKEIAHARHRSWKTINNSVQALCLKFGVNGRAELAAEALRRGIVAVTDDLPDAGN